MPTSHPPRRARETTSAACPWRARVWAEWRAGNLSRDMRDVLLTLRTFRGTGGLCMPSHATLAARARCSVSTVARALKQAKALGLLAWAERRRRVGWRSLRSSNSYAFPVPADAVQPGMKPVRKAARTACQPERGGESQKSKKAQLAELMREAANGPDLLALRRQQIEARLVAERAARMAGR
jgi:DNA-binding transcriptional MocR family regulator